MSTRRNAPSQTAQVQELQKELTTLRQAALDASADGNDMQATSAGRFEAAQAFEALTPTEQAAASLGVHPEAFRPIGFMNTAHYQTLLKMNALDDDLARRIEAYKSISA